MSLFVRLKLSYLIKSIAEYSIVIPMYVVNALSPNSKLKAQLQINAMYFVKDPPHKISKLT